MAKEKKYQCKACGNIQDVSLFGEIMHPHLMFKKKKILIKCPKCGDVNYHVRVEEKK